MQISVRGDESVILGLAEDLLDALDLLDSAESLSIEAGEDSPPSSEDKPVISLRRSAIDVTAGLVLSVPPAILGFDVLGAYIQLLTASYTLAQYP